MTIDDLNACDRGEFVRALGWIVEASPWVAERAAAHRPFDSLTHLHAAMSREVTRATRDEQLALLGAHPDLGTRARMSDASAAEQAGAGLDRLAPGELEKLTHLTAAYREKFGFPFLFAVKGTTARQILEAIEHRLASDPADELAEALRQVSRIAWFRLEETVT